MTTAIEKPDIDFLILADRAEGINGKLYMMGGAWDQLNIPDVNAPAQFAVAVGLLCPWHATNEPLPLRVVIENEDGTQVMPPFEVNVQVGRPSTARKGQSFRSIVAINLVIPLPGAGGYRVVANFGSESVRRVGFWVNQVAGATQ